MAFNIIDYFRRKRFPPAKQLVLPNFGVTEFHGFITPGILRGTSAISPNSTSQNNPISKTPITLQQAIKNWLNINGSFFGHNFQITKATISRFPGAFTGLKGYYVIGFNRQGNPIIGQHPSTSDILVYTTKGNIFTGRNPDSPTFSGTTPQTYWSGLNKPYIPTGVVPGGNPSPSNNTGNNAGDLNNIPNP